jgi:uncharacterized protein (TIGR03086 family)
MAVQDDFTRAVQHFREKVHAVADDQWTNQTPCTEWDVRALVNHLVNEALWVKPLIDGRTIEEVGDRLDGDVLREDPVRVYDASAQVAAAAFEAPGALDAPCAVSYGPVPGSVYAGHRLIDVLIHGWDLAVATDQDTTLDPGLVEACLAVVEPQADQFQASGAFGTHVDVPAGADVQTRLLGLLGRRPSHH